MKRWRDYQEWAMAAKQEGYPLCLDCHEPLSKGRWGKSQYCFRCENSIRRMHERLAAEYHYDRPMIRNDSEVFRAED